MQNFVIHEEGWVYAGIWIEADSGPPEEVLVIMTTMAVVVVLDLDVVMVEAVLVSEVVMGVVLEVVDIMLEMLGELKAWTLEIDA